MTKTKYHNIIIYSLFLFFLNSCLKSDESERLYISKEFYENGNLKYLGLKTKDSIINGKVILFDFSGQKLYEGYLIYGMRNGKAVSYNNGRVTSVEYYLNDSLHGEVKYYNEGDLEEEGQYENGEKTGFWHLFIDNKLIESKLYKKDSLNEVIYRNVNYFENGTEFQLPHE